MSADAQKSGEEVERLYTIPLSKVWVAPKHRRSKRTINVIKEFAERHLKSSEIIISPELNEFIWSRGIQNPPRRVLVKMAKDKDGVVTISLPSSSE